MSTIGLEELEEIVEGVWMTVLDLPVIPGERSRTPGEFMAASIEISGAWRGAVWVRTNIDFLTYAASHVFLKSQHEVVQQDRMDTITELTNMIGGTVKVLLPEVCDLSLPAVMKSAELEVEGIEWAYFSCNGCPVSVAVVAKEQSEDIAA